MWMYILRRMLNAIPILLGVNILTFALFFVVNSPEDIANIHLGNKYVSAQAKNDWKKSHGYDLPLFYNASAKNYHKLTETIFYQKSLKLFVFDFGLSDNGRNIMQSVKERYIPSLSIAIPSLFLGLFVNIALALFVVLFRGSPLDTFSTFICVILLSISTLFFIIGGQYLFAKILRWVPISGYADGFGAMKFILLPVFIAIVSGLGPGVRWYRAIFLEELDKDYVRTARAKGLSWNQTLFKHVLKNAMIPILTGVVSVLPLLFMGSLLMESFFAIPGLGSFTIDAIQEQDFAIVRVMVFLGTVLYIVGLILTDISYAFVDPRLRFSA